MAVLEVLVAVGFTTQAVAQEILRQHPRRKAIMVGMVHLALSMAVVAEEALLPLVVMQQILAAAVVMEPHPQFPAHL
jgi:hypothetical protein